jgi:hypothetical protein
MKVMFRRGICRLPITIAEVIAPIPPTAKIRPRSAAEPCRSLRTTKGRSTSDGPQKIR